MSDTQRRDTEATPGDGKPLPLATPTSEPFWSAVRQGRVDIQYCSRCDAFVFYPRSHCPGCLGEDLEWRTVSGRGHIHSFTIAREPTAALFADETPQVLAIVELDEGPRLTTTIVDTPESSLVVGAPVVPRYDARPGGVTLLRYRVADGPVAEG